MSVHIDEVNATVEAGAQAPGTADHDAGAAAGGAAEVRLEELRPLVRALVAEEIERWTRSRGLLP